MPSIVGERAIKLSLAQLLDAQGVARGCGLLVNPQHVVTCAHVVAFAAGGVKTDQLEVPTGAVQVTFPYVHPTAVFSAHAIIWKPIAPASPFGVEDIAVLQLDGPTPADAIPHGLLLDSVWAGKPYMVHGFPESERAGAWADGVFKGEITRGWVQMLSADGTDLQIDKGFSGAGVWDVQSAGFAGIMVANKKRGGQLKPISYMIPGTLLQKAWSDLPLAETLATSGPLRAGSATDLGLPSGASSSAASPRDRTSLVFDGTHDILAAQGSATLSFTIRNRISEILVVSDICIRPIYFKSILEKVWLGASAYVPRTEFLVDLMRAQDVFETARLGQRLSKGATEDPSFKISLLAPHGVLKLPPKEAEPVVLKLTGTHTSLAGMMGGFVCFFALEVIADAGDGALRTLMLPSLFEAFQLPAYDPSSERMSILEHSLDLVPYICQLKDELGPENQEARIGLLAAVKGEEFSDIFLRELAFALINRNAGDEAAATYLEIARDRGWTREGSIAWHTTIVHILRSTSRETLLKYHDVLYAVYQSSYYPYEARLLAARICAGLDSYPPELGHAQRMELAEQIPARALADLRRLCDSNLNSNQPYPITGRFTTPECEDMHLRVESVRTLAEIGDAESLSIIIKFLKQSPRRQLLFDYIGTRKHRDAILESIRVCERATCKKYMPKGIRWCMKLPVVGFVTYRWILPKVASKIARSFEDLAASTTNLQG